MEMKSPQACPPTVTIRRNPPRKARATPSSAVPLRQPFSSPSLSRDIFAGGGPENPGTTAVANGEPSTRNHTENLKVYLRIRPPTVQKISKSNAETKNAWPKNPKANSSNWRPKTKKASELCVQVNEDLRSVTVATPQALQETKRIKSEVHVGFSRVFGPEASQSDVYEEMVKPMVDDFLKGKSGMLAAMGPSGSGKTHTVFGCAREPGMVPLALYRIFSENKNSGTDLSRVFYLSMFEISSEKGKGERMVDLLHDGGDICMQHSVLKGLQEAMVCDAQQAESLIAHGMLKRATAITNSNSQSSRSQCIINIRCDSGKDGEEADGKASSSMLTIVDLAGAEREKKTGNQGARLLESNFINNTSMVFGLCLRSLLEHQKSRNKVLQKHYKNSLLTRYLRDYLEGKKRMMLILTVKPGVEDYLDTSFLLRQASPFTKIKFKSLEEAVNLASNKRRHKALPAVEQPKKMKFSESAASLIDEGNTDKGSLLMHKEITGEVARDCLNLNIEDISDENLKEVHVSSDGFVGLGIKEESFLRGDYIITKADKNREYQIMQGLSKALLTVLKQYKNKLKDVEIENCHLKDSLINEKRRSQELENKLASEKKRLFDLEKELVESKSLCTCRNVQTVVIPISLHDATFNLSQYQRGELQKVNLGVPSNSIKQEQNENEERSDPSASDSVVTSASWSGGLVPYLQASDSVVTSASWSGGLVPYLQQFEGLSERCDDAEVKGINDISAVHMCPRSEENSRSTNNAEDLTSYEDKGIEDVSSRRVASSEYSSESLYTGHESEQDAVNVRCDVKKLTSDEHKATEDVSSRSEASIECTSESPNTGHESKQDAMNGRCDKENLEEKSDCVSNGSCRESSKCSKDYEDLEDAKQEPTQLETGAADGGLSLVEDQTVSVAASSHTIINSSESPKKDNNWIHGDEEQLNNEANKLDPLVAVPPKEEWDAKNMARFMPKHNPCSNFQLPEKPKRRLLPASSVLLKDVSILDIKDENDKPKGARGGKRVPMNDKNRTQGSLSLLNLLTSKLDR